MDVFAVQKILLKFLFGDSIRGLVIELGEHPHGARVSFLGALTFAVELKHVD
jgi:hypothetical protein